MSNYDREILQAVELEIKRHLPVGVPKEAVNVAVQAAVNAIVTRLGTIFYFANQAKSLTDAMRYTQIHTNLLDLVCEARDRGWAVDRTVVYKVVGEELTIVSPDNYSVLVGRTWMV